MLWIARSTAILALIGLILGCASAEPDPTADLRVARAQMAERYPQATTRPTTMPQRDSVDRTVLVLPYDPEYADYSDVEYNAEVEAQARRYLRELERDMQYDSYYYPDRWAGFRAIGGIYRPWYYYGSWSYYPNYYRSYYPGYPRSYYPYYYTPYYSYYRPHYYYDYWSHYPYYRYLPTYVDRYRHFRDFHARDNFFHDRGVHDLGPSGIDRGRRFDRREPEQIIRRQNAERGRPAQGMGFESRGRDGRGGNGMRFEQRGRPGGTMRFDRPGGTMRFDQPGRPARGMSFDSPGRGRGPQGMRSESRQSSQGFGRGGAGRPAAVVD